jgi:hypothetical protein
VAPFSGGAGRRDTPLGRLALTAPPLIVFGFGFSPFRVHNASVPFRWQNETNDEPTAVNEHLEQSRLADMDMSAGGLVEH